MRSPIKYFGGKGIMINSIVSHFPSDYDIYIEGFGGGASVLLSLEPLKHVEIYNDLNDNVYSLFKVISDKEMYIRMKERFDLSYYSEKLRNEYKELLKTQLSIEDRAYYFLYVNRTSFNGIGGFSITTYVRRSMARSTSDFLSMIDGLPELHDRMSSVIISQKDIFDILEKYNQENVFIYLDPPYVHSTRKSLYRYEIEFSDEQHKRLCETLLECKCKVLVSGYDSDIYKILDTKFTKTTFKAPCSDSVEVLWKNYDLDPLEKLM